MTERDPEPGTNPLSPHPEGSILAVRVAPCAGMSAVAGVEAGALRVKVATSPVDGAANAALLRFLADAFGLPKSRVRLLTGETSRQKRLLLVGITPSAAAAQLALHLGSSRQSGDQQDERLHRATPSL